MLIVDPDLEPEPPASLLRRLYGLTRSEAEIALMVMRAEGATTSPTNYRCRSPQ